jgi:hypothetical protein
MGFELFCALLVTLAFASLIAFYGYRMLFLLLPIWGFFWGFAIGAQSIQAVFGQGFLSTTTSWVVGFVLALLFAVLSYLFFYIGVAILAGTLGYGATVAILGSFMNMGFLLWIIALVVGVLLAFVVLRFNIIKHVVIIGTALVGSAAAVGAMMTGFVGAAVTDVLQQPVQFVTTVGGWFAILLFLAMAIGGAYVQYKQNANFTFEAWENRV